MLIYVASEAFPHRNFTVVVQPHETIARVRAQLLHILYDIGKDDFQFRLRFHGQYLRDAYTVSDYALMENALIKMIPLTGREGHDSLLDLRSLNSLVSTADLGPVMDVKDPLMKEIKHLKQREKVIRDFRLLMYFQYVAAPLAFLAGNFWYSGCVVLALGLLGAFMCPTFSRMGGFIGKNSIYRVHFCILYGILSLLVVGGGCYVAATEIIGLVSHGCGDFVEECTPQHLYNAVYITMETLLILTSSGHVWWLLHNMRLEVGDLIEEFLVQSRDIEQVMKAARTGRVKDRRIAAFELATLATSSDDNKFRIVAEGGLDVLLRMAVSHDESTQEHAVEAVAELLTIPAIQDTFVELGGVRTLTALLHSPDPRLVYEAASALSYIVSDSEENKTSLIVDHGLEDLCFAALHSAINCQRIIAGIFLDLAFHPEVRSQMAALNSPAKSLIALCKSNDSETQRFALQTLELLAIESSEMICAQDELLPLLLDLPTQTLDERAYLLAGKILLYFAENREMCEALLEHPRVKEMLGHYATTQDPILQKVVVKVIYSGLEYPELKAKALHLKLDKVLSDIRENAADREAWDMADQALQVMNSDEDSGQLGRLPSLSTAEKLSRMDGESIQGLQRDPFETGSQLSLRSNGSAGKHSFTGSISDMKKGID